MKENLHVWARFFFSLSHSPVGMNRSYRLEGHTRSSTSCGLLGSKWMHVNRLQDFAIAFEC